LVITEARLLFFLLPLEDEGGGNFGFPAPWLAVVGADLAKTGFV
jgi:hypothetical protein